MKIFKNHIFSIFAFVLLHLVLFGCGAYSFTGTSLSPDIKTISVDLFADKTGTGPPDLSQTFSEKTREYYQNNTKLSLVPYDGDLQLSGAIIRYDVTPIAATANEVASKSRLTITVAVEYANMVEDDKDFKKDFSFYAEFDQSENLANVEQGLIDQITDQIILEIFNATVADW